MKWLQPCNHEVNRRVGWIAQDGWSAAEAINAMRRRISMGSAALHPSYDFLKCPLSRLFPKGERYGGTHAVEILPACLAPEAQNYGDGRFPLTILLISPAH